MAVTVDGSRLCLLCLPRCPSDSQPTTPSPLTPLSVSSSCTNNSFPDIPLTLPPSNPSSGAYRTSRPFPDIPLTPLPATQLDIPLTFLPATQSSLSLSGAVQRSRRLYSREDCACSSLGLRGAVQTSRRFYPREGHTCSSHGLRGADCPMAKRADVSTLGRLRLYKPRPQGSCPEKQTCLHSRRLRLHVTASASVELSREVDVSTLERPHL